ncbi:MAG: hypothetical protein PUD79_06125 [Prevotellaceae bacterium]|nr:hypothetical protein [Prevotellaceae bacterium]
MKISSAEIFRDCSCNNCKSMICIGGVNFLPSRLIVMASLPLT